MKLDLATDKVPKYASGESGDTFEVVERPQGGLTAILADGQGSGVSAKLTSNMVAAKAASLIADGTRDGAVSRAAHDFLYTQKRGRVSSTLTMVSCDLNTKTFVISRNSNCPVIIKNSQGISILDEQIRPIGFHYFVKPTIDEISIEPGTLIVCFSDGILHSGRKFGNQVQIEDIIAILDSKSDSEVENITQELLELALTRDNDRPQDDMAVMAVGVSGEDLRHKPRKLRISFTY